MEIKKIKQDIATMIVLMTASVLFYFVFIPREIPLSSIWSGKITFSSRTFPYILSVLLFIASGVGLARAVISFIKAKKEMNPKDAADKKAAVKLVMPFVIYALILAYCILFEKIGYIFSTLIIPPIIIFALGCRKWQFYLATYVFAAVMYVTFKVVLNIPLP